MFYSQSTSISTPAKNPFKIAMRLNRVGKSVLSAIRELNEKCDDAFSGAVQKHKGASIALVVLLVLLISFMLTY